MNYKMIASAVLFCVCAACGNAPDSGAINSIALRSERLGQDYASKSIISSVAISKSPNSKLDPYLNIGPNFENTPLSAFKSVGSSSLGMRSLFIKSSDTIATKTKIISLGGSVGSIAGKIMTAVVSLEMVQVIQSWPEVIYIEAAKPINIQNDKARISTGVDAVLAGPDVNHPLDPVAELTQPYNGKGVIVGIIDSGLDLKHPSFFDENGESRVLFVWNQSNNSGPGPSEIESTYGTECNTQMVQSGSCDAKDLDGHGTHVAGIAAGRDEKYGGVAPAASLIIVKDRISEGGVSIDTLTSTICDGANYIFKKADAVGMPAVVNISLGMAFGSHDNTSLFEECLNELADKPGHFIVAAAGNSSKSLGGAHIGYPVTTDMNLASAIYPLAPSSDYITDIWENGDCNTKIAVYFWHQTKGSMGWTGWVEMGKGIQGTIPELSVIVDRTDMHNALNGKNHSIVDVMPNKNTDMSKISFDVAFSGRCSGFNAWVVDDATQLFGPAPPSFADLQYMAGDNKSTIVIPATAAKIIAVGSYTTRVSWTDILGISENLPSSEDEGSISTFSSQGPAIDKVQGVKPFIVAPGAAIISALSSDAQVEDVNKIDALHLIAEGTSMASPHMTGIMALALEANPKLKHDDIVKIFSEVTRGDERLQLPYYDESGFGHVNAVSTLLAVAPPRRTPLKLSTAVSPLLYPTGYVESSPAEAGSSGCSLIRGSND